MESIVSVSYETSILLQIKMLDIATFEKGYEKAATGSGVSWIALSIILVLVIFNSPKMFHRPLPIQL
jgi:hypothetical protein